MLRSRCFLLLLVLVGTNLSAQQLSLGNTPYMVNKSAVLELNSTKQGLLLPRLSDTVSINALNPPDGMVVYFTPSKQFLLRANGYWNALTPAASLASYWATAGNANGAAKRFGNTDNYDLSIITNNVERMRLTAGGNLGIGTASPATLLHIAGTNPLSLTGVQTGTNTTADSLLTINNGLVQKLPAETFQNKLNGTGFVKASGTTITYDNNSYTVANAAITGATKTKITYDSKGLVTAGADATTTDIAEGTNLYYTDSRVRSAPLTGLSTAAATAVTTGDNVLTGVGKLQGQINAINGAGYLTVETDPLAAKKANNLSDLVNIATARINLGATTVGTNFFTLANPSAVTFPRMNADNSVSALDAATFRSAIGAGTGGVSSVSVVPANGFAGSVATSSSTPAITLSTTVTGLLKGNAATGALSAAVAGTDYQVPILLPYVANRYYNGYGNFVALNTDSIAAGATNLFATAAEKSTWNAKESAITAPSLANRYWNGYKQFVALNTDSIAQGSSNLFYTDARVRAAALTGLSTATATAVTGTDNLLAGIGKLQGQINAINSAGYQTGNQSINWMAGGDASGSASGTTALAPSLTVTGLRGAALPALTTGMLKYNGSAWAFDNSSYLTSETSTLANVTSRGNTTATGISVTQNGNIASSFALYLKRNSDVSPLGNLIQAQNAAATTDLFKVDAAGNTTASAFIKNGGTASQFLKADGTVDNNSYLTANQSLTLSGDVTGSGATSIATAIGANKVTLSHMAQVATGTFLGRATAATGNVEAMTIAQAKTLLGLTGSNSGDVTLAGQNYLSLSGQAITANPIDLSGTHATGTLAAARFGALTGDVTNLAGSYATTIANGAVTYAKMQNVSANNRLLGRATTGAGSPEEIILGTGLSLSGNTLSATAATSDWSTTGNSGIVPVTNFLGTTTNVSLRFRTNNAERMIMDSLGRVGIGASSFDATNPEKFLVNAGTTTSYNLLKARGSINNYLQMNLQNLSTGTSASTDFVATADNGSESNNYIDMGINGSGYTGGYFGDANDSYLYNMGQDFLIGTGSVGMGLYFMTAGSDKVANTRMYIDGNGSVGIGATSFDPTSPEKLLINSGTSTYTPLLATGSINSYFQINVKNTNTGTQASSDLVATANNGTETTNFVNLGINGSNYVYANGNPIETGKANDGYLISAGNDFYIVNNNATKDIAFLAGGTASTNETMRITSTEKVGIGTSAPSEKLHVVLSTGIGPAVNNIMTVETNNTTATSTSATPNISFARQVPSFAASSTYPGPILSFGFRTSGTLNNFAQLQSSSGPTSSKLSFYSRTGMTNANPATGTLAESMTLEGSKLGIGITIPAQTIDVNGDAGVQTSLYIDKANANTGTTASGLVLGGTGSGEVIASKRTIGGNQYGIDFYTASANRMVIANNGNVGIGTTTPADKLSVAGIVAPTSDAVYTLGKTNMRWNTVYSANGFLQTSDRRLKTNIRPLQYGLKEVLAMEPVHYNWKTAPNGDRKVGFIAQEVRQLVPEVVNGNEATENLSMNYAELVPVLVNAIKDQQKEMDDMRKDMRDLRDELMRLKAAKAYAPSITKE